MDAEGAPTMPNLIALIVGALLVGVPLWAGPGPERALVQVLEVDGAGYLGVRMRDVTTKDQEDLGLEREMGVVIEGVEEDSPAARAGLQEMDVILEYSGIPVLGARQFRRLVSETPAGRTVDVKVWRARRSVDLKVEIGERKGRSHIWGPGEERGFTLRIPEIPEVPLGDTIRFHWPGSRPRLGISGSSLTEQMAEFLGIQESRGVLVMEVFEGTPAEKAGLRAGDVVTAVNGKQVGSPEELSSSLGEGKVKLEVNRRGQKLSLEADLGGKPEKPASGTIRM
jgi:serine protease Do